MPYNVTIDDISPIIRYAGNWTDFCDLDPNKDPISNFYSGKTFHSSSTPGSTATTTFNGTAIYIYGSKRTHYGYYTVSVDNKIPKQFDAYREPQTAFGAITHQVLFAQTDLEDTLHEVVLTNAGGPNGRTTIDIDYVIWTSARDSLVETTILDDTDRNWTYTGPWEIRRGVDVFSDSTHLVRTLGSQATFTFEGVAIYLYGHLWNDHGWFNVTIDDAPPVMMNSFASAWFAQVPLYYADGLGPGTHTLTATNAEEGKVLSLDSVRILKPQPTAATTQSTIDNTPHPRVIGGITGGVVVFIILAIALVWYLLRLRRHEPHKSVDSQNPRTGMFVPPPIGYAPRSAGPGWVDSELQPERVPYPRLPTEKAPHRSAQAAPNPRL